MLYGFAFGDRFDADFHHGIPVANPGLEQVLNTATQDLRSLIRKVGRVLGVRGINQPPLAINDGDILGRKTGNSRCHQVFQRLGMTRRATCHPT